jgi:1,2-diacylglycerol 3-alpha-glucosyltransferase
MRFSTNVIGVLWAQYGPYHFARVSALAELASPRKICALELANLTRDYQWKRSASGVELITLCPDAQTELLPFTTAFLRTRRKLAELGIRVCLLPSYMPKQSLAAFLAAKSLGIRTVMMNETHAGTVKSGALGTWVKRRLVRSFDAALVGGEPHKRYFASLGFPMDRIFTGYDAVDNDYFAKRAGEVRARADEYRARYSLPAHYFLSLGRFVAKKNLALLLRAYRKFLERSPNSQTHLVMVGSGEEEAALRSLCGELRLPICDHLPGRLGVSPAAFAQPGVHFYGFRQVEENPVFYGLADSFILPSLWEEWGLVVNEAMASGLPVVVSGTAGCVEDLLEAGQPALAGLTQAQFEQRLEQAEMKTRIRRNGFVFDPRSADELARIMFLLESVTDLGKVMGEASSRIVQTCSCQNFARNALRAMQAAFGE